MTFQTYSGALLEGAELLGRLLESTRLLDFSVGADLLGRFSMIFQVHQLS
jgi:hypothetical protein